MFKRWVFIGIIFVLFSSGCKTGDNLELAYEVKAKKDQYSDTVKLLKTEGDLLASQINNKVKLFAELPEGNSRRPDAEEIIRLQNTFSQMQTRKINEQQKYISELESVIQELIDPEKEVISD